MKYRHEPCLLAAVLHYLQARPGGTYVDATIGAAGHAGEIAQVIGPTGKLVGIDEDLVALGIAAKNLARIQQTRVHLIHNNFRNVEEILKGLGLKLVDGFLFDLGLSSGQIEDPQRGFSYQWDGPLDMRFNPDRGPTAGDIVARYSRKDLASIIKKYGEERWADRIAFFIVKEREKNPITTTQQLVGTIKKAIPASQRRSGGHPAKRTFQALRIEVNQELIALKQGLISAVNCLKPRGRIVVISYHSLEDRIVKRTFKELATGCVCPPSLPECRCGKIPILSILTKRVVRPSREEIERNPRAKSARLRAAQKVA